MVTIRIGYYIQLSKKKNDIITKSKEITLDKTWKEVTTEDVRKHLPTIHLLGYAKIRKIKKR